MKKETARKVEDHKKVALNVRCIPPALRKQFKLICAENELTMEKAILIYMEYVSRTAELYTQKDLNDLPKVLS